METNAILDLLPFLTPEERAEVDKILAQDVALWRPLPGPQSDAFNSRAQITGYGGAAGGGKTDLACGLAVTQHQRTMILRREATQLTGIIDRLADLLKSRDGYNGQERIWRLKGRQIEFGSVPNVGDETKYQGRPHDLLIFDEAANFLEYQVRFLLGWLRTTDPKQRCRALLTFNPPTTAEGRWLIPFFGPWLDDKHPNPAKPGEIRWFATIKGKDEEVESGEPIYSEGEKITPTSRTFIPSRISDNPFLVNTGYMATLQSLPEPLRSQMLKGDFLAGVEDDPWQVIPTAWVDASMARWEPRYSKGRMDSMGSDVARGGRDSHVIARRHGNWFDELIDHPGITTPDGPTAMGQIIQARRDLAPVHIDIIGWGSSPYDFLIQNGVQAIGVNNSAKSYARTKEGSLSFANLRAEYWWQMRESLDPQGLDPVILPPDNQLRADLCAPRWKMTTSGILIESKDDVKKRIGRSPDRGDAACLANHATAPISLYDQEDDYSESGRSSVGGY